MNARSYFKVATWLVVFTPASAFAQGALKNESLIEYIRGREDLPKKDRAKWELAIKIKFGGAALDEDNKVNTQITVAKEIISTAIFMEVEPKKAVEAAFEGYRGVLGFVPPPLAVHYQILSLEGRKPKGSQNQLTFDFPKYYNDEIAPELVAYWQDGLKNKTIPSDLIEETKSALAETRIKMRPLLADKLRLLAALSRERALAKVDRQAEIDRDIGEVEAELQRAFTGVATKPEILDSTRAPYTRLSMHLAAIGGTLTTEDQLLDPAATSREAQRRIVREAEAREEAERQQRAKAEETERLRLARAQEEAAERERARIEGERRAAEAKADASRREQLRRENAKLAEQERRAEQDRKAQLKREDDRRAVEKKAAEKLAQTENKRPTNFVETDFVRTGKPTPPPVQFASARIEPQLVATVESWLGTPYHWGNSQKRVGTDCSGFTRSIAAEGFVVDLPRVSRDQYRTGSSIKEDQLQPGDLVFFDTKDTGAVNHVGIYAGANKFAHASSSRGVVYDDLTKSYFKKAYRGARRILEAQ